MSDNFYCNLSAIDPSQRENHQHHYNQLDQQTLERRDIPNGYAFRYPTELLLTVAEFINLERLCCPFLHFTVIVEPHQQGLWLQITAAEDVRPLIAEMGSILKQNPATNA